MAEMATKANDNHISGSGIWGLRENIVCGTIFRKLSTNGDRSYTGAAGKISDH